VKFGFVAKHRGAWPVNLMCEALGVSRSGYYAWLDRPRSRRCLDDEVLGAQVRSSFIASDRVYGARRVWHDVLALGQRCGLHRVERLMRAQALRARPKRRGLPKDAGQRGATGDNLLDRQFQADAPNRKWVADFTYTALRATRRRWAILREGSSLPPESCARAGQCDSDRLRRAGKDFVHRDRRLRPAVGRPGYRHEVQCTMGLAEIDRPDACTSPAISSSRVGRFECNCLRRLSHRWNEEVAATALWWLRRHARFGQQALCSTPTMFMSTRSGLCHPENRQPAGLRT
jgi:hypothetical protein